MKAFDGQGTKTLAGATFRTDYFVTKENERNDNHIFVNQYGHPVKLMIFGEIAHPSFGTTLTSKGNHFMTPNNVSSNQPATKKDIHISLCQQYIVDSTKPKYCLALARPTCGTTNVNILFNNEGSELASAYSEMIKNDKPDVCCCLFNIPSHHILLGISIHQLDQIVKFGGKRGTRPLSCLLRAHLRCKR